MNVQNNQNNQTASFCFLAPQASFCFLDKNSKQQQRPTVELQLSDLTKTVRL
jgi:hypothetical protein